MSRWTQGLLVDELLEERGGVDRARLALRRGVGEVGDGALRQLLVLGVQRQPPGELAGLLGRRPRPRAASSSSLEISAA